MCIINFFYFQNSRCFSKDLISQEYFHKQAVLSNCKLLRKAFYYREFISPASMPPWQTGYVGMVICSLVYGSIRAAC